MWGCFSLDQFLKVTGLSKGEFKASIIKKPKFDFFWSAYPVEH